MSLIEGAPRNATIKTSSECKLLEIDKVNFDMLLRLNSFISLRIMSALTKRFRDAMAPTAKQDTKEARIITFFGPKGGSGKSIIATNMAAGLAKCTDKSVLLIDLDLQFGDLAFMLGLKITSTISTLIEEDLDSFQAVKRHLLEHPLGFKILASPLKPEQSETIASSHLRKICKICSKEFDYIIIDTHCLFQDLSINSMDISSDIMLVMTPEMHHIKGMKVCFSVMENLKYPPAKIKLVLNRDQCEYARSKDEIEEYFKRKFHYTLRDDYKNTSELINNNKTVFESATTDSEFKSGMLALIKDFAGDAFTAPPENKGVVNKLKSWFSS